jgi:hypothetical protein
MTKSEQARTDAMADADTFRWNVDTPEVTTALYTIMLAAPGDEDAIRAAFRAVPGLRGETK